jgi:transposase-like protein
VIHGLRGRPSNQRIGKSVEEEAVQILSADLYKGFGPTLASEYLADKHDIEVSKETVRQWMIRAKLWRVKEQKTKAVHIWRPRRSRPGELVQWDTSEHDWLEGRGEKMYLIAMIDDATSRLFARFVRHDSTEENMRLLKSYVEKFGRPLAFYTDKASLFRTAETGRTGSRQRPCGDAADADRARASGTGNRLDSGAQPTGERTSGEEFRNGTGSPGERHAGGWSEDPRRG